MPSPSPSRTGPLLTGPNVRPGEKPPVLDPKALVKGANGAFLFADFALRAWDWSLATNDPYLFAAWSAPTCKACARIIERIRSLEKKREMFLGGRISVPDLRVVSGRFKYASDYVVQARLLQGAGRIVSPSGDSRSGAVASDSQSLVFVSWVERKWEVMEIAEP